MFHIWCNLRIINIVILVTGFVTSAKWTIEDDVCETPRGDNGKCIAIYKCKAIIDVIPTLTKLQIRNLLLSHHCAFEGRAPKFCCPPGPLSLSNSREVVTDRKTPDDRKHRNLKLLPTQCGPTNIVNRIMGGNKAALLEFPWMALLSYRTQTGPRFKCGGTIINKNYILTAAHCIHNPPIPLLGIRIGEHNINTDVDCEFSDDNEKYCTPRFLDMGIEEIIPHPSYSNKTHANDIGLVRVRTISFHQEHIKPVCLPVDSDRPYNFTNRNAVVTGWGVTETGRSSYELLKMYIKTVPVDECQKMYESIVPITNSQLCAGGLNRSDSCVGDSGDPLQVIVRLRGDARVVQQGIVSFGPRVCGTHGLPGVYTKIAAYMDWILNTIKP